MDMNLKDITPGNRSHFPKDWNINMFLAGSKMEFHGGNLKVDTFSS